MKIEEIKKLNEELKSGETSRATFYHVAPIIVDQYIEAREFQVTDAIFEEILYDSIETDMDGREFTNLHTIMKNTLKELWKEIESIQKDNNIIYISEK